MQQVNLPKQYDPAPSRVKYKLHRMWLTPVYRTLIRTGLPVFCIMLGLFAYLRDPEVQKTIVTHVEQTRTMIEERPEFMIKQMRIQGATGLVSKQVRTALPSDLPISSFHLDLERLKAKVEEIEAVETASLLVGAQGVLEVGIMERVPVVVWRSDSDLILLDARGQQSGRLQSRLERTDLPLIAGAGVEQKIPEALEIFNKLSSISGRVRGLVRIGERRWDVVLDRNQLLQLPETEPIAALERIFALNSAQDILNRDVIVVDVRDGRKPILRLSATALDGLKKMRLIANADEEDS